MREGSNHEIKREIVYPNDRNRNRLPAMAWLIRNSFSINGSNGDRTDRLEKLRYQRLQNTRRRKIFMEGPYIGTPNRCQPLYLFPISWPHSYHYMELNYALNSGK